MSNPMSLRALAEELGLLSKGKKYSQSEIWWAVKSKIKGLEEKISRLEAARKNTQTVNDRLRQTDFFRTPIIAPDAFKKRYMEQIGAKKGGKE